MRIGYFFHGFLGDTKREGGQEVSTPDGNAAYSWSIVHEAVKRGYEVIPLHDDRDHEAYKLEGPELFESFSKDKRLGAYLALDKQRQKHESNRRHPGLDVVLIEWRWPIYGRNCVYHQGETDYDSWAVIDGCSNDLARQWNLLRHYGDLGVPIILWDLDHKLLYEDERLVAPAAVFETAVIPKLQHVRRTRVEPPVVVDDLLQIPTRHVDAKRKLVYVGSRYERDDVIDEWIKPVSEHFPGEVEFWGKWEDADKLWPHVSYHGRITMKDFATAYGTAAACPLLGKKSYLQSGFVTPRPWEALMFGTIPIGLASHRGIENYVNGLVAKDTHQLNDLAQMLSNEPLIERNRRREELAHSLQHCDASSFVNSIEDVVNGTPPNSRAVAEATKEGSTDGKEEGSELQAGGREGADEGAGRVVQPEVAAPVKAAKGRKGKA